MLIDLTRDQSAESHQSEHAMQVQLTTKATSKSNHNGSNGSLASATGEEPAIATISAGKCCICLEENDYRGSALLCCLDCGILVHAHCYGTNALQAAAWRCEVCQECNQSGKGDAKRLESSPKCAICHIEGGALRKTTEPNLWSHVLCAQWIPELNHSFQGKAGELIDIGIVNANRATLRCIVCGQRGGCIQCVSGRCAKSFHVICALRAPSDVIFTGYNNNMQIYHCKLHVNDVPRQAQRICDESWKDLPQVTSLASKFPPQEDRCRYCNLKVAGSQHGSHEDYCLLVLLSKEDAPKRKKHLEEVTRILEQNAHERKNQAHNDSDATSLDGLQNDPSLPSTPVSMRVQSPTRPPTGKNKRKGFTRRPCSECGMLVRDSNLENHLERECDQREQLPRSKKPTKQQQKRKRKSTAPASSCTSSPCGTPRETVISDEMTDVLFGYWPGYLSGSRLNSTCFWKLVAEHFFGSAMLRKRRTDQVCRSLVGVRLDDVGRRIRPNEATDCQEQVFFLRQPDSQALSLHSVIHRCDVIMRTSRIHCVEDPDAKPVVEIVHARPHSSLDSSDPDMNVDDGEIRVLFKNTQHDQVSCKFKLHLSRQPRQPTGAAVHKDPKQEARENELFANACWSEFQHNVVSSLSGEAIEQSLLPLQNDDKFWVSLDLDESFPDQQDLVKDELTPEISLLVERLKVQMRVNRYSLRHLHRKLQASMANDKEQYRLNAVVAGYYQELAWWKGIVANLLVGYKSLHIKQQEAAEEQAKQAAAAAAGGDKSESRSNNDDDPHEGDEIDDGTCVICFDGRSPETNPIIFCDRCNLAVHQKCYGVVNVPSSEFYCDRCQDEESLTSVFCQLCPLRDGAFKRTMDGKWVHVVCALWCPGVWINNVQHLSGITVFNNMEESSRIRFQNTTREIHEIQMATRLPEQKGFSGFGSSGDQQPATDETGSKPILPAALIPGSLCIYCRVDCGRTVTCSEPDCQVAFHPLCAWFHGLSMTIENPNRQVLYAGGGAGLKFEVMCETHSPDELKTEHLRCEEGKRRSRFRLDSYYITQSDLLKKPPGMTSRDGSKSKSRTMALRSGANDGSDVYDLPMAEFEMCSACFEYPSPIVSLVPRIDADGQVVDHVPTALDVSKLSPRQYLVRCQNCNVFVHPGCCGNDAIDPNGHASWICDRCKSVNRSMANSCSCVVCDRTDGLLLPCVSTQPVLTDLSAANAMYSLAMGLNHVRKDTHNTVAHGYDKWIHMFCSKWAKCKITKKNKVSCAVLPNSFGASDLTSSHCDLCSHRGRHMMKCGRDGCHKRFHPFCVARAKGFFTVGTTPKTWRFFCFQHPPKTAVFDFKRQTWFTLETMQHLQELRLSLERGRMLVEMCKRREKLKKASVLSTLMPLLEQSVEIVVKKRPTPSMKSVYNTLTGEILRDAPRKPPPPKPKVQPTRVMSRKRRRVNSVEVKDEMEAEAEPSFGLVEEAAGGGLGIDEAESSSSATVSLRRRTRQTLQQHEQQPIDSEQSRPSKKPKLENGSDAQMNGGLDLLKLNKRIFKDLKNAVDEMDFDSVVQETYPEMFES